MLTSYFRKIYYFKTILENAMKMALQTSTSAQLVLESDLGYTRGERQEDRIHARPEGVAMVLGFKDAGANRANAADCQTRRIPFGVVETLSRGYAAVATAFHTWTSANSCCCRHRR